MLTAIFLMLQDASAPAGPPSIETPLIDARNSCPDSEDGEIVVCGESDDAARYRLPQLDDARFAERPVRLGISIAKGVSLGATTVQSDQSAGVGIGLKIAF